MMGAVQFAPCVGHDIDPADIFIGALAPTIVETVHLPARAPRAAAVPSSYRRGPAARALEAIRPTSGKLWRHQAIALDALDKGDNVLVTTATGSGKSLIFQYPVLREMLEGSGTALVLYPQKALANDQLCRWRKQLECMGLEPSLAAVVNGQVSANERTDALRDARILLATPDVIHAWMLRLQATADVRSFLSLLRFVVIDEAHMFDGVFGSNGAYFFRRLRLAVLQARKDQELPLQLIAASATIGDPAAHVEALIGCSFTHISEADNGAPSYPMTLLHIEGSDRGRAAETEMADAITKLLPALGDESMLVFGDSRQGVERISKLLDDDRVLPYRNGYDRTDLADIENGLKSGRVRAATCTSAFEVGIDINLFRIGMNLGVPATRRALRQRAGRVGRSKPGLFAVVAPRAAFTKLGTTFEEFATGAVEPNHLHLQNQIIQYQQACCLRAELGDDEVLIARAAGAVEWPQGFSEALGWAAPCAHRPPDIDRVAQLTGDSPHHDFPLRKIADVSFKLRLADDTAMTLGDIPIDKAMREAYPGAIYLHMRRAYRVTGWRRSGFEHSILLRREKGKTTTIPLLKGRIAASQAMGEILDAHHLESAQGSFTECGMRITETVFGYAYGAAKLLYSDLEKKNRQMRSQMRQFQTTGVLLRISEPWFAGSSPAQVKIRKEVAEAIRTILLSERGIPAGEIVAAHLGIEVIERGSSKKLDDAIAIYDDIPGGLRLTQPIFDNFQEILDRLDRAAGMAGEDSLLDPPIIERLRDWYSGLEPAAGHDAAPPVDGIFAPGSKVGANIRGELVMRTLLGHQYVNLDGREQLMYLYEVEDGTAWVSAHSLRIIGGDWSFLPSPANDEGEAA